MKLFSLRESKVVFLIFLLVISHSIFADDADPIAGLTFADPDLKTCVESHGATIGDITFLDCEQFIDNLGGIEQLANLQSLNINTNTSNPDHNTVSDLTPLTLLPAAQLTQLHANGNLITVIPALTGIVGLNIGNNPITDLSSISSMTGLDSVWLDNLNIDDSAFGAVGPFNGKPLLTLGLGGTQVRDLSFLSGFTTLTSLDLWGTNLTDVSALSDLTLLQHLNLDWSKIADVNQLTTEIATLGNLISLFLSGLGISDLNFLSPIIHASLRTISLNSNLIRDTAPLSALTDLDNISIPDNALNDADLGTLSALVNLTFLDIDQNLFKQGSLEDQALSTIIFNNTGDNANYHNTPLNAHVTSASLDPAAPVNLDGGDQDITLAIVASTLDAIPVEQVCINLTNPAGTSTAGTCYSGDGGNENFATLDREAQRGDWLLSADVFFAGSSEHISSAQLAEMAVIETGITSTSLSVGGLLPGDSEGPNVTGLSLSLPLVAGAKTVNIDTALSGYVSFAMTLLLDDAGGSGVSGAHVNFHNPVTGQNRGFHFGTGQSQRNIVFSTADGPGRWQVSVSPHDNAGNNSNFNSSQLSQFDHAIVVVNSTVAQIDINTPAFEALFSDPDLYACVQAHGSFVDEITSINCGSNISELTGVEALFGLENLNINTSIGSPDQNTVNDLTPVLSLPLLNSLHVDGNQIPVIPALPELTQLNFGNNPVTDFSPILTMNGSRGLWLNGLNIDDVELALLIDGKTLDDLSIADTEVQSLSFLSTISNLQTLSLGSLNLVDVSGLTSLVDIKGLHLHWSTVDVAQLSAAISVLTSLTNLTLDGLGISDVSFLQPLTRLRSLSLFNDQVRDVSPLVSPQPLPRLDNLVLTDNALNNVDLGQLVSLTRLRWLDLDRNLFTVPSAEDDALAALIVANTGDVANYRNAPLLSRISAAAVSPPAVDLDDGDQTIFFSVTASIPGGGTADEVCINVTSPANTSSHGACYPGNSGSGNFGIIDKDAQRGAYPLSANVQFAATSEHFDSAKLAEMGISPNFLQVDGTGPGDSTPPLLTDFILTTTEVDVENAAEGFIVVGITVQVNDAGGSGVSNTAVQFHNALTGEHKNVDFLPGQTQRNVVFSTVDANGQWDITVWVNDFAGTASHFSNSQLTPFPESINITNPSPDAGIPVTSLSFNDTDLAACVQAHGTFVHEIVDLNCSEGISDLTGIDGLFALENLDVSANIHGQDPNTISDLGPALALPSLRNLSFADNQVTDLSGLTGLHLNALSLGNNPVSGPAPDLGFGPIYAMTSLSHLDVRDIKTVDLLQLSNLVNLSSLNISNIGFGTSLVPIQGLPLQVLRACSLGINDLSFLAFFPDLFQLDLCDNLITDISDLAGLNALRHVQLGRNRISDISTLAGLNLSGHLDLSSNMISSLIGLENQTQLNDINLWANAIVDVTPLAGLTTLVSLTLDSNRIVNAAPLGNLTALESLSITENGIDDINWLNTLTLNSLFINANPLDNAEKLALQALGIGNLDVGVSDIPTVDQFTVSPTLVNVDGGDQLVTITSSLSSTNSNNISGYCVELGSPGRVANLVHCTNIDDPNPGTIVIPAAAARGEWTFLINGHSDNGHWVISPSALGAAGLDNIITVQGTGLGDYKPPVLDGFTLGTSTLDIGLTGGTIAATTDTTDTPAVAGLLQDSGITSIDVQAAGADPDFLVGRSASINVGSQTGQLEILEADPLGTWRIDHVRIEDGAANVAHVHTTDLRKHRFATGFEVISPDQADDDGDGFGNARELLQGTDPNDITEFPGSGGVVFLHSDFIVVSESESTADVILRRGLSATGAVTIDLETRDGSALAGTHYVSTSRTITWLDGDTTDKIVSIPLLAADPTISGTYLFNMRLSNPTGGAVLGAWDTGIFIVDEDFGGDDGNPYGGRITFASGSLNLMEGKNNFFHLMRRESSTGSVTATYNITRTADVVDWELQAEPGVDFVEVISGIVTWSDGDTSTKTIPIDLLDDGLSETTEVLRVQLTGVSGSANPAIDTSAETIGTIIDDDRVNAAGVIGFAGRFVIFDEEVGTAEIPLSRLRGGQGDAALFWQTNDGSAINDQDFESQVCCVAVTWSNGEMGQKSLSIPITDDNIFEGSGPGGASEFFTISLFALSGSNGPEFDRGLTDFELGIPIIMDLEDHRSVDRDGDGIIDVGDLDDDNDGARDFVDNCYLTPNPDQLDFDADGLGDACDDDDDNDGIPDVNDALPFDANELQDTDGDGIGDNSDPDIDGDGVLNGVDLAPFNNAVSGFIPLTGAELPANYVNVTDSGLSDPTFATGFFTGATHRFEAGGVGFYRDQTVSMPLTWLVDGAGVLQVSYQPDVTDQSPRLLFASQLVGNGIADQTAVDAFIAAHGDIQVEVNVARGNASWYLQANGALQDNYWQTSSSVHQIVDDTFRLELLGDINAPAVLLSDGAGFVENERQLDDLVSLPIDANTLPGDIALKIEVDTAAAERNRFVSDLATFNVGGTGSLLISGRAFTWVVNGPGQLVVTVATTGAVITLTRYEQYPVGSAYYGEALMAGETLTSYAYGVTDLGSNDLSTFLDRFLGNSFTATNPASRDGNGFILLDTVFGFTLHTDGSVTRIFNALPESLGTDNWSWQQQADGEILLTAKVDVTTFNPLYSDCDLATNANCMIWRMRHWIPLRSAGDRLYVMEWEEISESFDPLDPQFAINIAPRVQFYELLTQDQDQDGVSDIDEVLAGQDPFISSFDSDNDGFADNIDVFPFDGSEWLDADLDGLGDNADRDDDNDGITDVIEDNFAFLDPFDPSDANLDQDGDTFSNLREIRAGTDPDDIASVPGPGFLSFTDGNALIEESDGVVPIEVRRLFGDVGPVSVQVTTSDGSAIAGQDYTALTTTLNWADGDSTPKTALVNLTDDNQLDTIRIFSINLSNPGGGADILRNDRIAMIFDDDTDEQGLPFAGTLTLVEFSRRVAESEGQITFSVDRGVSSAGTASVDYVVSSASATEGLDFAGTTGTLNWADGDQSAKTVTVKLYDDYELESVERILITLQNPSVDAYLTQALGTIEIVDEEVMLEPTAVGPVVRRIRGEEFDGTAPFRFVRFGDGIGEVKIDVNFVELPGNASATRNEDYDATQQSITWAEGETGIREITVPLINDLIRAETQEIIFTSVNYPAGSFVTERPDPLAIIWDFIDRDLSTDSDADGVIDVFELDDDGDGIIDFGDPVVNRYPLSRNDPLFETFRNTPLNGVIDVTDVAVDTNADPILIRTNTLQTANGTLSGLGDGFLFENGTFTYQPALGFVGLDMFDYFLCDPQGCSGPFVASVGVQERVITFDSELSDINGLVEDGPPITVDVATPFGVNFPDSMDNFAAIDQVLFSGDTTLVDMFSFAPGSGDLTLIFAPDQNGTVSVSVLAVNERGDEASSTFTITVDPVQDVPSLVGNGIEDVIGFEGADALKLDLSTVFNDPDTQDVLLYQVTSTDPAIAGVVFSNGPRFDIEYGGTLGVATVTLSVSDNGGASFVSNSFSVTIERVNVAGIVGPNTNVIGPTLDNPLHYADTALKQQNEVECVMRPDNNQHLFCQYNDYRGAEDQEKVGDSWQGVSMSRDGGLTWVSRLSPGWKGYTPAPIERDLGDGTTAIGGFAADPMLVATPGAVLSAFIVTDRDDKGPGGLYLQRWFEENTEVRSPWRPQSHTLQIVAGDKDRFIDKGDMAIALQPTLAPLSITTELEQDELTTETVTRQLPAANLIAAYTQFNSATDPSGFAFERGVGFDSPDFVPGSFADQQSNNPSFDWLVEPGFGTIDVVNQPVSTFDGALAIIPSSSESPMLLSTPDDYQIPDTMGAVVDAGFEFNTAESLIPGLYRVELGDQIGLSVDLQAANGKIVRQLTNGDTIADPFEFTPGIWHRLSFRLDFGTLSADVFLDGQIIAAGLPFVTEAFSFDGLSFAYQAGSGIGALFLDTVSIRAKETTSSEIYSTRSSDYGTTWSDPVRISGDVDENNTGVSLAAAGDRVLAVWRRFTSLGFPDQTNTIMWALSEDGGATYNDAQSVVAKICPFDQFATGGKFRTNGFAKAVTNGDNFYVFWSDRDFAAVNDGGADCDNGFARIVSSSLLAGSNVWTTPIVMDDTNGLIGHQLMPDAFAVDNKVQVVWYDTRHDEADLFDRNIEDTTNGIDLILHTVDVRAARLINGVAKPSVQVTQFKQGLSAEGQLTKLERSHPNSRIFRKGTTPFIGDYISVTGPSYTLGSDGIWRQHQSNGQEPSFFVAWADNRDIRGDVWIDFEQPTRFSPPGFNADSEPDPKGELFSCEPDSDNDLTLTRDQNIYGSMIQPAFKLSSPSIMKPTDQIQRGYVLYLQNFTNTTTTFEARIMNQPPDGPPNGSSGRASFSEFPRPPFDGTEANAITTTTVTLPARSAAVKMVYISSLDPRPAVAVQVVEAGCAECVPASLTLNGNPLAPDLVDDNGILAQEIRTPDIQTRLIARTVENPGFQNLGTENPGFQNPGFQNPGFQNPGFQNPGFQNPGFQNPGFQNPGFQNIDVAAPGFQNPGFQNPGFQNPGFQNPGFQNPGFQNPGFQNPGFQNQTFEFSSLFNPGFQNPAFEGDNFESFTDISWEVTNDGNTAGAVALTPFLEGTNAETKSQLMVTKTYATPTIQNCEPGILATNQVLLNIANPSLSGDGTQEAGTVFIEPGDTLVITLRVFDPMPVIEEQPLPPAPGDAPLPPLPDPVIQPEADSAGIAVTSQTCGDLGTCDEAHPTPPPVINGIVPEPQFSAFTEGVVLSGQQLTGPELTLTYQNVTESDIRGAFRLVVDSANLPLLNADGQTEDGLDFFSILPFTTDFWPVGASINVVLLFEGKVKSDKSKKSEKSKKSKKSEKSGKSKKNEKKSKKSKKDDQGNGAVDLIFDVELQRKAPPIDEM